MFIHTRIVHLCTVDTASTAPTSPPAVVASDGVPPPLLDCDRDTTFDDFDLETDERLEVTEMFHSSGDRDLARSRSRSGRGQHLSESDAADWTVSQDHAARFSIDIPASFRHCRRTSLLVTSGPIYKLSCNSVTIILQ